MAAALDFTYSYAFSSGLEDPKTRRPRLSLATCNFDHSRPYFFDGRVRSPRILGDMLVTLSDVVRTHFFMPRPVLFDPVLTSNEELLRLEGFSGCCGVYARVDLPAEAFEGECHGRGTTNVDFNNPMRNALMRLRQGDDVGFSVGKDEVVLRKGSHKTVEKKVKLPLRWIKGFSEVQAYQPRLSVVMEISAAEALRFTRSLPRTAQPKMPSYAVSAGKSIRLSQRPRKGAVKVLGSHRVKVIEPLLIRAKQVRVWFDDASGISAWEVRFPTGSFFLMLSPEVYRGFSGEGQVLSELAIPRADLCLLKVRAQLTWQSQIDTSDLAGKLGFTPREVKTALAVLGSRGLAGFDAAQGRYFHRELPFDLDRVEQLQPRLKSARKLVENGDIIQVDVGSEGEIIYRVPGTGTFHRVRIHAKQDSCTCPWFSKNLGQRGPCKHILAARLVHEPEQAAL